jgi:hypothetical protein
LDKKHSERAKLRGILNLKPASIIGYTGREDYFEVLSVFRRFITTGMIGLDKKRLVKLLRANQIDSNSGVALKTSKGSAKSLYLVRYMIKIPVLQRKSLNFFKNWQI